MFSTLQITSKYDLKLLMLVVVSIWCQSCYAKVLSTVRNSEHLNRNERCPGKNVENIWHPCEYGGYIAENPNPKICADRYLCYVGLNEPCSREDICADNAICTTCGVCQKCDSEKNCSEFELCPNIYGFQTMSFIKRFLQNRSDEINTL